MSGFARNARSIACLTLAAAVIGEAGVIASIYGYERLTLRWTANDARVVKALKADPSHDWRQLNSSGVIEPAVVSADESTMSPEEPVIGVEVEGKARAYRLGALVDRDHHLVNDRIGGVPVAVAYCDLTDCVQVYTGPRRATPLDVSVAGLYDGQMIVNLEGTLFYHKSGKPFSPVRKGTAVPFDQITPARTTWAEWKRRHPATEIYQGSSSTERP